MPKAISKTGSELFIVDNSEEDWKVVRYLHDWCQISKAIDIATGYFEIGSLLALKGEWQKVDSIRILMGDEVSRRTQKAFQQALGQVRERLDGSIEQEKLRNDFLEGVPAIVEAIKGGGIDAIPRPQKHLHQCLEFGQPSTRLSSSARTAASSPPIRSRAHVDLNRNLVLKLCGSL